VSVTDDQKAGDIESNMAHAAEVFSQYGDFIRSVIQFKVKDPNLVDDVFQDFFLSLAAKPIPMDVCDIKNYLYRAVINDSLDEIRRVDRYHTQISRYSKIIKIPVNKDLPENALIEKEEMEKAFKMVENILPSSEAQAVILKFKSDNDLGEASKQVGLSKRTVSRYVSVGLGKLRKFLYDDKGK
jgi:RNA polymerase sigma factor (sigma-70 family)